MPKSNLRVVDQSSDKRAELATAIATHQALSERLVAAVAAGGWEKRADLKRNVELAETALETAKTNAAKYLTDQMLGKTDEAAPTSIKEARAAFQDARDQLEVWETVSASLQAEVKKLREEVGWAKDRLESAVLRVIVSSPEAQSVFDRYRTLQRKLAGHRKLMEALAGYAPQDWDAHHDPDDAEDTSAVIAEWQSAIDTLARDAGAPLPKV